ncbi:MAG: YbaB/EbfC family nucleoid-associated protein [Micromonosporaceae bacterium]
MDLDIDALLAEHLGPAEREMQRRRALQEQLRSGEVEVRSPDRSVSITQTYGGEVLSVKITPGAFGQHDERSFEKVLENLLKTARKAGRQVAEKLADEVMAEGEGRRG